MFSTYNIRAVELMANSVVKSVCSFVELAMRTK